jgi:hypothetical protein
MIAIAEREKIVKLSLWVQWLLWATPFTAFVSGQNFRRHWIEKFSYAYFLSGVILTLLVATYQPIVILAFVLPFVVIGLKRFRHHLRKPTVAIASVFLLAPVIFYALATYSLALYVVANSPDKVSLWIVTIIIFVTGAAKAHRLIMTSRQALAQPATSLQGH